MKAAQREVEELSENLEKKEKSYPQPLGEASNDCEEAADDFKIKWFDVKADCKDLGFYGPGLKERAVRFGLKHV